MSSPKRNSIQGLEKPFAQMTVRYEAALATDDLAQKTEHFRQANIALQEVAEGIYGLGAEMNSAAYDEYNALLQVMENRADTMANAWYDFIRQTNLPIPPDMNDAFDIDAGMTVEAPRPVLDADVADMGAYRPTAVDEIALQERNQDLKDISDLTQKIQGLKMDLQEDDPFASFDVDDDLEITPQPVTPPPTIKRIDM